MVVDDHSQCFASEAEANAAADWLRTNDAGNVYVATAALSKDVKYQVVGLYSTGADSPQAP